MFDPVTYFENLTNSLKLTKDKYRFVKVDGIDALEGILSNIKKASSFIAVDVSENGAIVKGGGGGYFNRRPTTIFITAACSDVENKEVLFKEFRQIKRAFLSKLIKDRAEADQFLLDLERTPYYEVPSQFAAGQVGIYFMIYNDEPTNLAYDQSEWE